MADIDVKALAASMNGSKQEIEKPISHPDYYNLGCIEVIEAIESWGFGEGFNRGCAIKYIARAGRKDKKTEIEDLRKAMTYLQFEIDRLERQNECNV